jgi:enoyl-[acyl-carrier protein] reductase / trans-2-enoyl-CoA reductase (NAD+)
MIVTPRKKGFIYTNAHPAGCKKNVENQIDYCKSNDSITGPKKALIIGCSAGYGLASRIVSSVSCNAMTIGVSYEREAANNRTASAGWYNNIAFENEMKNTGLYAKTINGDAFAYETKQKVGELIKSDFGKIDMLIYSLASPRRTINGITYNSVIKPIGSKYKSKTINFEKNEIIDIELEQANEEEILSTIKVMGGEDWRLWIEYLMTENLLSENFITMAYSYIGPDITHPIYLNGTIGAAKKNLKEVSDEINDKIKFLNGNSYVSINKAIVTQASCAIPVVPLYISILYKVMKEKGIHENCIQQIYRLFSKCFTTNIILDNEGYIRMDDYEMNDIVQSEVLKCWNIIDNNNILQVSDIIGFKKEFDNVFGFEIDDVNYENDVEI